MTSTTIDIVGTIRMGIAWIGAGVRAAPVPLALLALAVAAFETAAQMQVALGWLALLEVLQFLAGVFAVSVLLRTLVTPTDGGLRWGPVEWRLTSASLLAGFFYLLISLFALVAVVIAVVAVAFATGGIAVKPDPVTSGPAVWTAGVVVLVYLLALIWCGTRLALLTPATVAAGRIQVFSTWPLTRGRFWPIFIALVVSALPAIVVWVGVGAIAALIRRGGDDVGLPVALAMGVVAGGVVAFVQTPLSAAVLASLYRHCAVGESLESPAARAPLSPAPV